MWTLSWQMRNGNATKICRLTSIKYVYSSSFIRLCDIQRQRSFINYTLDSNELLGYLNLGSPQSGVCNSSILVKCFPCNSNVFLHNRHSWCPHFILSSRLKLPLWDFLWHRNTVVRCGQSSFSSRVIFSEH